MFGSTMLEVAIGVVFVYVLLSLVCSALTEWVARLFALRETTLYDGIRRLLADPDDQGLTQALYDHPLIAGLAQSQRRTKGKPAWITPRTFALALMDRVAPLAEDTTDADRASTSHLRSRAAVSSYKIAQSVLPPLVDAADGKIETAIENIERWFNEAMVQVTDWYKRKTQWIILGFAVVVCGLFNIDTIMIANHFSRDATLRASLVAAAETAVRDSLPKGSDPSVLLARIKTETAQLGLPIGWQDAGQNADRIPGGFLSWLQKVGGLLMSVVAVSLGAPFWFDLLNRLLGLRRGGSSSSGQKEEKTPSGS